MACNGDYGDKTADEMKAIYTRLASNSQQKVSRDTREVANEVGSQSTLAQQVANLTKQIALLVNRDNQPQAPEACGYCGLKLSLSELKPTTVSLQLADRSVRYPVGILEDLLVKTGKYIFPVDFLIMDVEYDMEVPIILGRPFLSTGGALIDVRAGLLTLRVGDEEEKFHVYKALKGPSTCDSCFRVE
ncbi:hypothetical protein CCACVL1_02425, partial [Corchorus capsularis]